MPRDGERKTYSVLTPYFNAQHRDHFHLDLARYRINGTHPREVFFHAL